MLNRVFILVFLSVQLTLSAQMIESESRPYSFDIDKILEYQGRSASSSYDIVHPRVKIRDVLQKELSSWFRNEGQNLEDDDRFQQQFNTKINDIQPLVIQEVGLSSFQSCTPVCFFNQSTLQFEVQLDGFRPFNIGIPLAEVESFRNHFDKLQFSDQKIAFNELDQFVITYVHIFNPDNGKKYIFYNSEDETIHAPTFSISFRDVNL